VEEYTNMYIKKIYIKWSFINKSIIENM
jgi:hypothetical protein